MINIGGEKCYYANVNKLKYWNISFKHTSIKYPFDVIILLLYDVSVWCSDLIIVFVYRVRLNVLYNIILMKSVFNEKSTIL